MSFVFKHQKPALCCVLIVCTDCMTSFYAYDDPNPTHVSVGSFNSKVIELERKDYYTWLGLECSLLSSDDRWVVSFAIAGSPFTYFDSLDSHLVRTPPIFFNDIGAAVCICLT